MRSIISGDSCNTKGHQLERDLLQLAETLGHSVAYIESGSIPNVRRRPQMDHGWVAISIGPRSSRTSLILLLYDAFRQ